MTENLKKILFELIEHIIVQVGYLSLVKYIPFKKKYIYILNTRDR